MGRAPGWVESPQPSTLGMFRGDSALAHVGGLCGWGEPLVPTVVGHLNKGTIPKERG